MKYIQDDNKIILTDMECFNIKQILECGQCFRFEKLDEAKYKIIAKNKVLFVKQTHDKIEFYPTTMKEFEEIWIDYFDLKRDYKKIINILSKDDPVLKNACEFAPGIRILKQEPWECIISFIISQNNRIPMIKKVIKNISEKYGDCIGDEYSFPMVSGMKNLTEEELMLCKTGFRAKYIIDAVKKIEENKINLKELEGKDTEEIKKELMSVKGIGEKVSDCILLFSFSRSEVFPTDVWIKRVMEHFYFEGKETPIKEIHKFAKNKFGIYAGFAQQYLFYYVRESKGNIL